MSQANGTKFGRSRSGCAACRRNHRKCDEQRPACIHCRHRSIKCDYQKVWKWASVGKPRSAAKSRCQRSDEPTRRPSAGKLEVSTSFHLPQSETNYRDYSTHPSDTLRLTGGEVSSESLLYSPRPRPSDSDLLHCPPIVPQDLDVRPSHHTPSTRDDDDGPLVESSDPVDAEVHVEEDFHHFSDSTSEIGIGQLSDEGVSTSDANREVNSTSIVTGGWDFDSSLADLLGQIIPSSAEMLAFMYYMKRVCSCTPAYDSSLNPYRKMALLALSYPVLLNGILSVSTAHMHNYGRSNEALLSSRQSRALTSLRSVLDSLQTPVEPNDDARRKMQKHTESNVGFSVLSAREIALAAIMMQTTSVLLTGVGNVDVHMKCALYLIQDLGYLRRPPCSVTAKTLIHRFAMVDVILAHLRFRRPMAPGSFFMYQEHEKLDHEEPSFRDMHGCHQRVLCFLAQISVLSVELAEDGISSYAEIQARAYSLETEMRVWGRGYHITMACAPTAGSTLPTSQSTRSRPESGERSDLDVVCECFYWTAHILLLRRVFLDPTRSSRVQLIRRHLFGLMDGLVAGCGPDSSLSFPFYMAAREATTLAERDWVRRKHTEMLNVYRDRSREFLMTATEMIWESAAKEVYPVGFDDPFLWQRPHERLIRTMDQNATYFMF
ncbi:uncharacterized protein PV06_03220 [Exophiala oligosperma]|uniref:Zn(2)-C6 fungal-type domain-containing protein n=1 Tax=Exophiala oligosperma TaxID=215243 RepID=A0A0D2C4Q4_9EURO|nr:uncharacterized protein PV06_03220 [Exophiala oligosperma]KIW44772.1 hypothetical protein PV06_03220 [Exophiala oligosperma]